MNKNLSIVNQNNKLMLKKSKSLMSITNNILSNDDWVQRLWDWADENNILEYDRYIYDEGCEYDDIGIPRQRDELLKLTNLTFFPDWFSRGTDDSGKLVWQRSLDLSTQRIMALPSEIGYLYNLTKLKFSYCGLIEIPKEIKKLINLTRLDFHSNEISKIEKGIFSLHNLQEINFSGNKLTEIPKEIGLLTNLRKLDLSGNQLTSFPKEVANLVNLKKLSIGFYNIERVPKEICNIPNLTMLSFDGDRLIRLPKEIKKLTKLTQFRFSSPVLTEVPKEICELINLTKLWLGWNKLSKLPKEIKNLTELTILNLSSNELIDLPEELCELINLTELSLGWNKLTKLPKELVNLTELKELDLRYNPNLILTTSQIEWVRKLIKNGCDVMLNDRYENLHGEFELERRYKYLDEFNIGREVPITPEMLENDIPPEITAKLAEGKVTFEEYLDEVSKYLDKEKFNNLVEKLFDRSFDLGECFERNITFNNYEDNQLVWTSTAEGKDKKMLTTHWSVINMFVKEIFGQETKITNIAVTIE